MKVTTWRKPVGKCSLHVDDQCVERGDGPDGAVIIRNSTDPQGELVFTAKEWETYIATSDDVNKYSGGAVVMTHNGVTLKPFTEDEWRAFLADASMRQLVSA